MMGCCGQESLKFKDEGGNPISTEVERVRIYLQRQGVSEEGIAQVLACTCDCHRQGVCVLC